MCFISNFLGDDRRPFVDGLRRLRDILNDPISFEGLVEGGVKHIFVLAGIWQQKQYAKIFGYHHFSRWVRHERMAHRFGFGNVEDHQYVRSSLVLLRDTLNDRAKFRELATFGPCALWIHNPVEDPTVLERPVSVLISNHTRDCEPNSDGSLREGTGLWFHG